MKSVEEMDALLAEEGLEVKHYGTKGMKWGVRKRRDEKARAQKFGASKDAKRATAATKKARASGVKALTNQELKDLNSRTELESKYLRSVPKSNFVKGGAFVGGILAGVGSGVAKDFANKQAQNLIKTATTNAAARAAARAAAKPEVMLDLVRKGSFG